LTSPERHAVQAGPQAGGELLPARRARRKSRQRGISEALQEQIKFKEFENTFVHLWLEC